jgi:uncharacterized protein (DUF1697 family)
MPRYIAFLRAINVSGRNVKMEYLRLKFEELGFNQVETFIASGNVFFESPTLDEPDMVNRIQTRLAESLGFQVPTFLRTDQQLASIAQYTYTAIPEFNSNSGRALNVAFLSTQPNEDAISKLFSLKNETDNFIVHKREIYWLCQKKQSESTFSNAVLEKTMRCQSTMRGIETIQKMAAKYQLT